MAGLLAARTLSDFFQTVAVVERDVLPDDATNGRGVPWRAAWAKHHAGDMRARAIIRSAWLRFR